jgi:hypothetical protein
LTENLDEILAIAGLVASLTMITILLTIVHQYLEYGLTLFLGCAIYLFIKKLVAVPTSSDISALPRFKLTISTFLVSSLLFFTLFLGSILSVVLNWGYTRPPEYFVLTAGSCGLVAFEILTSDRNASSRHLVIILIEIILIGFSLRWIPQLMFPSPINVDSWFHEAFSTQILNSGRVPAGTVYSYLPFMHLIVVTTMSLTGLSYKFSAMLSVSFSNVISLVFIFLLGKSLFDWKAGMLSALLLGVADSYIELGSMNIPFALGLFFFSFLAYVIFGLSARAPFASAFLTVLTSMVLILTHTMASAFMALFLILFWLSLELFDIIHDARFHTPQGSLVKKTVPVFFVVAMFAWWTYASGTISKLADLIRAGFNVSIWRTSEISIQYTSQISFSEHLLNVLGFLFLVGFSIIGFLFMLSRNSESKHGFAFSLSGIVLVTITFVGWLFGISGIIPSRWLYFSEFIMVIPAAVGIFLICQPFRGSRKRIGLVVFLVTIISFLMITDSLSNIDSPIYSADLTVRYALKESEMQAMYKVATIYNGTVVVDGECQGLFLFLLGRRTEDIASTLIEKTFNTPHGILVVRKEITEKPFFTQGGEIRVYNVSDFLNTLNRVYDSNEVAAFMNFTQGS